MLLLLCCIGCGGANRAAVSGKILVDGQPLDSGTINFFPTDGAQGPSVGTAIQDGQYHIPKAQGVIVGKNRVEIRGFRKTGRKIRDIWNKTTMNDQLESAVPAEFNDKSTLVREVQKGDNVFDFELKGIPGTAKSGKK